MSAPLPPTGARKFVCIRATQRWECYVDSSGRAHYRPCEGLTLYAIADDGTAWTKEEWQTQWAEVEYLPQG